MLSTRLWPVVRFTRNSLPVQPFIIALRRFTQRQDLNFVRAWVIWDIRSKDHPFYGASLCSSRQISILFLTRMYSRLAIRPLQRKQRREPCHPDKDPSHAL